MVETADSVNSIGAGVSDGSADDEGVVSSADGGGVDGNVVGAPAVADATWSSDSGSDGAVGMAWRGDSTSHGGVCIEGG
jgi:hypothetical protein